jgi:hypothetical protein
MSSSVLASMFAGSLSGAAGSATQQFADTGQVNVAEVDVSAAGGAVTAGAFHDFPTVRRPARPTRIPEFDSSTPIGPVPGTRAYSQHVDSPWRDPPAVDRATNDPASGLGSTANPNMPRKVESKDPNMPTGLGKGKRLAVAAMFLLGNVLPASEAHGAVNPWRGLDVNPGIAAQVTAR